MDLTRSTAGHGGRRRLVGAAAVLVIGTALTACGSTSKATTTATSVATSATTAAGTATTAGATATTAGFTDGTIFTDAKDHFSIVVPSSWQQIDLTDPAVADKVAAMKASNPKLASLIGNTDDLATKGTKYLAIDPSGTGQSANVVVNDASGAPDKPSDKDLEDAYTGLEGSFSSAGGTILGHRLFTLNGHRTLQVTYDFPLQSADGSTATLHMRADVVVTKDALHILTLPAAASADPIESSFHII